MSEYLICYTDAEYRMLVVLLVAIAGVFGFIWGRNPIAPTRKGEPSE